MKGNYRATRKQKRKQQKGGATRQLKIFICDEPECNNYINLNNINEDTLINLVIGVRDYLRDNYAGRRETNDTSQYQVGYNLDTNSCVLHYGNIQEDGSIEKKNFPPGQAPKILTLRLTMIAGDQDEKFYIRFGL